jgi:tetratricopeptide (TPR) repeat protein
MTEQLDADSYNKRGVVEYRLGHYEDAIADFTKAIELKPNFAEAYHNRGNTKHILEDYEGAIADFTKAIEYKEDFAKAYFNRGLVEKNLGVERNQYAITDFNKSESYLIIQDIELKHDFAEVYFNRGWSKRNLVGSKQEHYKYEDAIADLTKAIESKEDFAEAYCNRGLFKKESGDPQGAITDYKKAADLFKRQNNMNDYNKTLKGQRINNLCVLIVLRNSFVIPFRKIFIKNNR